MDLNIINLCSNAYSTKYDYLLYIVVYNTAVLKKQEASRYSDFTTVKRS